MSSMAMRHKPKDPDSVAGKPGIAQILRESWRESCRKCSTEASLDWVTGFSEARLTSHADINASQGKRLP